jgi:hypothetical protein
MELGWKAKAERLRMVILSAAHQLAKELPPTLSKALELYARLSMAGAWPTLQDEMGRLQAGPDEPRPLWEPIEVHGWKIQATLYRKNDQLWWLVHAVRKNERDPSDKDVVFLDKVLDHLGAEPLRHMIVGPRSNPRGEPEMFAFGWWTWQNRWPLFEVQVNKSTKRDVDKVRIVPAGSRETDGYTSLATDASDDGEPQ